MKQTTLTVFIMLFSIHLFAGLDAFVKKNVTPQCSTPPTLSEVKTGQWAYRESILSESQAVSLGVPVAKITGSHSRKIFVRDYSRFKSCISTDGITKVNYGQVIRTVVEIEEYNSSAELSISTVAASGTLNHTSQKIYIYKDGFYNEKIDDAIMNISGKTLTVETYADYDNIMKTLISLLNDSATVFSVNIIGYEIPESDEALLNAPIITYIMSAIKDGKSGNEIKSLFPTDSSVQNQVVEIFASLDIPCNDIKPTELAKLKCKQYLKNFKIRM